jgi:hypothetical protein
MDSRPPRPTGPGRGLDGLIRHRWVGAAGMTATVALVAGGGLALVFHDAPASQRQDCGLVRCAAALPPSATSSTNGPAASPSATGPTGSPARSPSATGAPSATDSPVAAPGASPASLSATHSAAPAHRPARAGTPIRQPFPGLHFPGQGGTGRWPADGAGGWPAGFSGWPGQGGPGDGHDGH